MFHKLSSFSVPGAAAFLGTSLVVPRGQKSFLAVLVLWSRQALTLIHFMLVILKEITSLICTTYFYFNLNKYLFRTEDVT